jgi:ACS family tartrate transporter-like MFS transporter
MTPQLERIMVPVPVVKRIFARVVWPLFTLFLAGAIDRVNLSFAALQMNGQLNFNHEVYGFGVSFFFLGYLLFQIPSLYLLRKIGVARWCFVVTASAGVIATLMAFVSTPVQFYSLRFLLGVAEAGLAPGIVYIVGVWIPRSDRAAAIARTQLAAPISIILGGPLSGWLMTRLHNTNGLAGWQWMFIAEGLPTICLGVILFALMRDKPTQAKWLSHDDAILVEKVLAEEQAALQESVILGFRDVLTDVRVWCAAGVWLTLILASYSLSFWLPLVVKQTSGQSDLNVGFLSALPWLGIGAGMLFNARHSDRTGERYFHIGVPAMLSAIFFALSLATHVGVLSLLFLILAGFGLGSAQSVFWTIPSSIFGRGVVANGLALINICGSVGGMVGSSLIGVIRQNTGSFTPAILGISAMLVFGVLLLIPISRASQARSHAIPLAKPRPGNASCESSKESYE